MRVISPAPQPDDKQNLRYMIRQTRTCVATHTSAGRHILYEYIYQVCESFVFYLSIAKTRHDANFGDIKLLYNTQEKNCEMGKYSYYNTIYTFIREGDFAVMARLQVQVSWIGLKLGV